MKDYQGFVCINKNGKLLKTSIFLVQELLKKESAITVTAKRVT
jgi:hypothetical protein